jgi:serine/threonine protein kinase/tetratricopeptide (TPR) repeat protein
MSLDDAGRRWHEIDALFQQALDLRPDERADYLNAACGGDSELRAAVERLLSADANSGDFLEIPVAAASGLPWDEIFQSPVEIETSGEPDRRGERVGPYRLLRQLGRGGMATVYLAERADGQWEQEVAVKVIRRGLDTDDVVRRFRAERQILSSLQHPHIARLLDGGTTADGLPFLVLEYVSGVPITEYCDANALSIERRLALFCDVARAVHYAHQNLVVHRDLKPSNVLVEAAGRTKLLDFGIAKLLDPTAEDPRTRTGLQLLTPQYASPEQVRGDGVTTASDVYQLGLLLCELLTGRRPYPVRALSPAQVEAQIVEAEPAAPSALVDAAAARGRGLAPERIARLLRGDLDTIVLTAIRKEPERRYASAEALAHDVERYVSGFPIDARPDSRRYRLGKWMKRHRTVVFAAAAVATLLVGWATTVTMQSRVVARERDRAQSEARRTAEVRDFLAGLFAASDPFLASARPADSITARELLDAGAKRLRQLDSEPALRAELAFTIGKTYRHLGVSDRSRELLSEALVLHLDLEGESGASVARDLFELGLAESDIDSSIALLERSLTVAEGALGPSDLLVADVLTNLAERLGWKASGETPRIRALFDRALAILNEHPDAPRSQYAHALKVSTYGTSDVATMERVLAINREIYGDFHPVVAASLSDLALTVEASDPARAESLLTEALAIDEALLGEEHQTTRIILNNLAGVKRDRGDFAGAVPLYRRALALLRAHEPEWRTGSGYITYGLGVSLHSLGRHDEAEPYLREAVATLADALGEDHALVFRASTALARCLRAQDRLPDAEQLLTGLRARFDAASLAASERALVLDELAALYAAQGRETERARIEQEVSALTENGGLQ